MESQKRDLLSGLVFDIWKEVGKESEIKVCGYSMRPLIRYGSTVIVKHTVKGIKPGSIIAFKDGKRIIVHRVIRLLKSRNGTFYVTKGDANRNTDHEIKEDIVIGKVVAIVRKNENKTIELDKPFWLGVGYIMAACANINKFLPERITESKISRWIRNAIRALTSKMFSFE